MARLKGGSHVAGDMTVEGILTVQGFQHEVTGDVIFTGSGDLTVNRIQKAYSVNQLVDSSIIDTGTLVTIDVATKISSDLEVTGSLQAANIYLEEDENSGNGLKLRNNSGLTLDRSLTFNINDADKILELTGNAVLNQDLTTTANVTHASLTLNGNLDSSGIITLTNTSPSTSTITGAVLIAGGLGVAGDIHANKVYGAVYNDVAEFMYKAEESRPGNVMIMTEKGVVKSTKRAMKSVVGIHSESFGYALGSENMEKKTPIGLTGRVPVFIREKCKIGDELVSSKNGEASVKRWYDSRASIIGKSMEEKNTTNLLRVEMLIK